jgi:hypothetical protein
MEKEFEEIGKIFGVSQNYVDLVSKAYNNKEGFFIENSSISHAKFLSYFLIKKAEKNLKIFTGFLKEEKIYADEKILEILKEKLSKGVEVEMIVEKDGKESKIISLPNDYNNFKLFKAMDKIKINHFLLSDKNSFRVEEIPNKCPTKEKECEVHGVVSFNCPKLAENLENTFIFLRNSATQILT